MRRISNPTSVPFRAALDTDSEVPESTPTKMGRPPRRCEHQPRLPGDGGSLTSEADPQRVVREDRGHGARYYWRHPGKDCLDCKKCRDLKYRTVRRERDRARVCERNATVDTSAVAAEARTSLRSGLGAPDHQERREGDAAAALAGDVEAGVAPARSPLAEDSRAGTARATPIPRVLSRSEILAAVIHGDEFGIITDAISEDGARRILDMDRGDEGLFGKLPPWDDDRGQHYTESAQASGRWMLELDEEDERADGWLERLTNILIDAGVISAENHHVDGVSRLESGDDSQEQAPHKDFNPNFECFDARARSPDGTLPYPVSCLIALQDGATITDRHGKVVHIPRLGACIFRGDLTHAGSSYLTKNVRVHVYFAYAKFLRPRNHDGDAEICMAFGPRDELLPYDFERVRASSGWARIETYIRDNPEVQRARDPKRMNLEEMLSYELGAPLGFVRKRTSHIPGRQEMVNGLIAEVMNAVRGRDTD